MKPELLLSPIFRPPVWYYLRPYTRLFWWLTNCASLFIVYLFVARSVLSYFSNFIFRIVGLRMSANVRHAYLKALFALPVSTLDTLPSGQASNTLTNTANLLQLGISEKLGMVFQFSALWITAVIVAFTFSVSIPLSKSNSPSYEP